MISRLPVHDWPKTRLEIVAIDAGSGERIALKRESGISLIDAVAASSVLPCVYPATDDQWTPLYRWGVLFVGERGIRPLGLTES